MATKVCMACGWAGEPKSVSTEKGIYLQCASCGSLKLADPPVPKEGGQ